MTLKNGGPAFPFEYQNKTRSNQSSFFIPGGTLPPDAAEQYAGITLREYYAAHAPAPIPEWFQPVGTTMDEERYFAWRWHYADQMLKKS